VTGGKQWQAPGIHGGEIRHKPEGIRVFAANRRVIATMVGKSCCTSPMSMFEV